MTAPARKEGCSPGSRRRPNLGSIMGFWKWVVGFKDKACKIRAICDSPCQERRMQPRKLHQEPKYRFNNGILEVG